MTPLDLIRRHYAERCPNHETEADGSTQLDLVNYGYGNACLNIIRMLESEARIKNADAQVIDTVMRYIDRMNDVAPDCGDPADRILNEFTRAMKPILDERFHRARESAHDAPFAGSKPFIPQDVLDLVQRIGRAEWGQTFAHDADGHADHVRESVKLTAENFGQTEPQHMHGLFVDGTETVICHTGTSPNSPAIAQALTGAWNWLYDQGGA